MGERMGCKMPPVSNTVPKAAFFMRREGWLLRARVWMLRERDIKTHRTVEMLLVDMGIVPWNVVVAFSLSPSLPLYLRSNG